MLDSEAPKVIPSEGVISARIFDYDSEVLEMEKVHANNVLGRM